MRRRKVHVSPMQHMNTARAITIAAIGLATAAAIAGSFSDRFSGRTLNSAWTYYTLDANPEQDLLTPRDGKLVALSGAWGGYLFLMDYELSSSRSWKMSVNAQQLLRSEEDRYAGMYLDYGQDNPTLHTNATILEWGYDISAHQANLKVDSEVVAVVPNRQWKGTMSFAYTPSKDRLSVRIGTKTVKFTDFYDSWATETDTFYPAIYEYSESPASGDDIPWFTFDNFSVSGPGVNHN